VREDTLSVIEGAVIPATASRRFWAQSLEAPGLMPFGKGQNH